MQELWSLTSAGRGRRRYAESASITLVIVTCIAAFPDYAALSGKAVSSFVPLFVTTVSKSICRRNRI